jgi:drug/metabolite transporter (DMT)-like permease
VTFAFVIVSVIAIATEQPFGQQWPGSTLFAVAWLGIFGSGLAYILNFRLLSRIGAGGTVVLAYLLPIVGIVSGFLLRGEGIDVTLAIGTALILGGIGLATSKRGQRTIFGRAAAQAAADQGAAAPAAVATTTAPGAPPPPR